VDVDVVKREVRMKRLGISAAKSTLMHELFLGISLGESAENAKGKNVFGLNQSCLNLLRFKHCLGQHAQSTLA
jgi:hypothetical protein